MEEKEKEALVLVARLPRLLRWRRRRRSFTFTFTHPRVGTSLLDSAAPGSHLHISRQPPPPPTPGTPRTTQSPWTMGGRAPHLILRMEHRDSRVPTLSPTEWQHPSNCPCRSKARFPGSSPPPPHPHPRPGHTGTLLLGPGSRGPMLSQARVPAPLARWLLLARSFAWCSWPFRGGLFPSSPAQTWRPPASRAVAARARPTGQRDLALCPATRLWSLPGRPPAGARHLGAVGGVEGGPRSLPPGTPHFARREATARGSRESERVPLDGSVAPRMPTRPSPQGLSPRPLRKKKRPGPVHPGSNMAAPTAPPLCAGPSPRRTLRGASAASSPLAAALSRLSALGSRLWGPESQGEAHRGSPRWP